MEPASESMDTSQIDLWDSQSGDVIGALFSHEWDGVNARLSIEAPQRGLSFHAEGADLFSVLQDLRKESLEPLGLIPLCNGARVDCRPSGLAASMGGGMVVYVLSSRRLLGGRPLVGTFDPAPKKCVGTVDAQNAYFEQLATLRGFLRSFWGRPRA